MDIIRNTPRYLVDELLADLKSGHNIRGTIYMECGAMYRADGPDALKCVGETEFVNGVAAMTASGLYGDVRACAGIVGHVDLRIGDAAEDVLRSHIAAGHGRFRGIRHSASYVPIRRAGSARRANAGRSLSRRHVPPGLQASAQARPVVRRLASGAAAARPHRPRPQLPRHTIVLDHVGTPLGIGSYKASARNVSASGATTSRHWPSAPM